MTSEAQKLPKSYLDPQVRDALIQEFNGDMDLVYSDESWSAAEAGDYDAAWAWLLMMEYEAETLLVIKMTSGAQFIKDKGFNTEKADKEFGEDWLENFGLKEFLKM